MRTSLTAFGVSLGVMSIVAFSTLVRGMWAATDAAIHLGEGDMIIFQAGVAADIFSTLDEAQTRARLTADPDVERATAWLLHVAPVEGKPFMVLFGARKDSISEHYSRLIEGAGLESDEDALLGRVAAKILEKRVGDTVTVAGRRFRVTGIFTTGVVYYDGAIALSLPTLQEIVHKQGLVTSFQVRVRAGADPQAVAERIEREHPDLAAVVDASQYKKVDQGLEMARSMVSVISFLALVIGSLIVANTMWMSVNARTREIGILRAVGWSKRRILAMILIESAGVGLIACALGCLLGVGLAELTTWMPMFRLFSSPVYDAVPFLTALAVAVVLSVGGGAAPAWRAARISPVEALRYE